MPKLQPFALADVQPTRKTRPHDFLLFFALFAIPLIAVHLPLLSLPFFWDEAGQFIPTALDLFRHGDWVARSTIPNVHPPGVEAYLAIWYKLVGFSIPATRVAMLLLASAGLLITFLLAIELSKGTQGAPAFLPPLLLFVSPLFYTQSMMAQLDMPATVFSLLALLFFLQKRYALSAAASLLLVLSKETGLVVPIVLAGFLLSQREWRRAAYFTAPAVALGVWLLVLHHATGYWLGDPGFAHYNIAYSLHPVRLLTSLVRRIYYLFFAEFRWIGTVLLLFTLRSAEPFRSQAWRITVIVFGAQFLLVTVLGGAELERYLLPVLPIFYIAVAVALTFIERSALRISAIAALVLGLAVNLFWNPPYPFPYENNWAMVDFVRLQQSAAGFSERNFPGSAIATAWPFSEELRRSDLGYVSQRWNAIETNDFHYASIAAIPPQRFNVLITYTRTWAPAGGVLAIPFVRDFLSRYYDWQPEITAEQCAALGLHETVSWQSRGQSITVYRRR